MEQIRNIEEITSEFEAYSIQLSEQKFNQIAGLPYDKDKMEELSQSLIKLSSEFLNSYNEPRVFYLNTINTIAQARKLPTTLEIYEKRATQISSDLFKIHNLPVNWGSWRQFNAQTSKSEDRKVIFDEFIKKAPELGALIEKRFNISRQVFSLYNSSPLEAYLESEFISYDKLKDIIITLGDGAKSTFLLAAEHFAPEILGKSNFEYYDDFYTARGRIYTPLNQYFEKKNPIKVIYKILSNWGFEEDLKTIKVDSEDREKKSPSAFCFGIQIPNDIRIVYKRVSPFSDFTSVFHEFGHAVHGTAANPKDSYWKRYIIPRSVAETFSIFIEMLMQSPNFLKEEMNFSEEIIQDILDRRHFINLYFLVFYAANSLMKLEYWKNEYSLEQASTRYQELTKRFFWEIPGNYWLLHHVMPDYDIYSPSYLLASIRVKEWIVQMVEEYGEEYWKNKQAGTVFKDLAATRGEFDLSIWDMKPEPYIEEQSEFNFLKQ